MDKSRAILLLAIAAVVTVAALPCRAAEKDKDQESIWTEDEGRGPGPGRGPGRGKFDLTEEEIDRIMEGVKQRDPEKAKELAKLREKDPEKFQEELRRHGREEFGRVVRERIQKWRQERQTEFIEWLGENDSGEARELAKIKERNPDLYDKKYELAWKKYGRIFEESRRNPELAEVLLEDLKLQEKRDGLLAKIKATKNESEKRRLTAQLEKVVSDRYDLIVRRKQIAYERLLKWLEELRNRIKERRAEIEISQKKQVKAENVKKRMQELFEGNRGFNWD